MQTLSVGDCIRYGWETFKQRPGILIGGVLVALIVSALPNLLGPFPHIGPGGEVVPPEPSVYGLLTNLLSIVVSIGVSMGLVNFSLRAHDDIHAVQISDLWKPAPFWRYLGNHIPTVIAIGLGLIALVVPGLILLAGLAFGPYLVVDRGLGPIEAMKESWRVTNGHKGTLLLLFLALLGITLLGLIAFFIGIFITMPIVLVAVAHAYRTLTN